MYTTLKKRTKGYTLIELLIVMAIISLIVLVTLAGLSYGLKKGRDTRRVRAVTTIQTGLQAYYADNNTYVPADAAHCTTISGGLSRCDITWLTGLTDSGDAVLSDPSGAPLYTYFEEDFAPPISIQSATKDLDNTMGYYVDSSSLQYAVCTVTELASTGNVDPVSDVNDEGTDWGCYCVGPLARTARCQGLEDPNGLAN